MCKTCGCSETQESILTNMQTGNHFHLDQPGASFHTHAHSHEHSHTHSHEQDPAGGRKMVLEQKVLEKNDRLALQNRNWFSKNRVLALNIMSSPGSGKTSLLEKTVTQLKGQFPISIIEGDQATTFDAERMRKTGCRVVQINTGTACHLDADMIAKSILELQPPPESILFIENVGNLVCPSLFDLGEHFKVVLASVTEGEDKPLKYPSMFHAAEIILLNKTDLLAYVDFSMERFVRDARRLKPDIQVIPVSAKEGDGLKDWYDWICRHQEVGGE